MGQHQSIVFFRGAMYVRPANEAAEQKFQRARRRLTLARFENASHTNPIAAADIAEAHSSTSTRCWLHSQPTFFQVQTCNFYHIRSDGISLYFLDPRQFLQLRLAVKCIFQLISQRTVGTERRVISTGILLLLPVASRLIIVPSAMAIEARLEHLQTNAQHANSTQVDDLGIAYVADKIVLALVLENG
jgi:hypothetical protein